MPNATPATEALNAYGASLAANSVPPSATAPLPPPPEAATAERLPQLHFSFQQELQTLQARGCPRPLRLACLIVVLDMGSTAV